MKSIQQVEPWYEPSDLLREKMEFECEMNREDHGFLCGMIKAVRPAKIVEIGVAEGGTTSVIMNCLAMLNMASSVYSVDLNQHFYQDISLKTGYEYEKLKEFAKGKSKHEFLFGKTIAGQIDIIGKNIDMVIIDTTHSLPGEILDFLAIFPFLSQGAFVLLHDINLNYSRSFAVNKVVASKAAECVATKILLMTVTADKYINCNDIYMGNIGTFQINQDTNKYICSLFFALTMTWSYQMREDIEEEYRTIYERYYDKECLKWFDLAVYNNKRIVSRQRIRSFLYEKIPKGSNIILYAAGNSGKRIYAMVEGDKHCNIIGWVDKNYNKYMKKRVTC